jgi:hypothetical protein
MHFACWIKEGYKHLLKISKTYSFSKEKLFRERTSTLCHTKITCSVFVLTAVYFNFPPKFVSGFLSLRFVKFVACIYCPTMSLRNQQQSLPCHWHKHSCGLTTVHWKTACRSSILQCLLNERVMRRALSFGMQNKGVPQTLHERTCVKVTYFNAQLINRLIPVVTIRIACPNIQKIPHFPHAVYLCVSYDYLKGQGLFPSTTLL